MAEPRNACNGSGLIRDRDVGDTGDTYDCPGCPSCRPLEEQEDWWIGYEGRMYVGIDHAAGPDAQAEIVFAHPFQLGDFRQLADLDAQAHADLGEHRPIVIVLTRRVDEEQSPIAESLNRMAVTLGDAVDAINALRANARHAGDTMDYLQEELLDIRGVERLQKPFAKSAPDLSRKIPPIVEDYARSSDWTALGFEVL